MADLGNLFFSLGLKTEDIDNAWNKALEKYKKAGEIDIRYNDKSFRQAIESIQRIEMREEKLSQTKQKRVVDEVLNEQKIIQSKERTYSLIFDNERRLENQENKKLLFAEQLSRSKMETENKVIAQINKEISEAERLRNIKKRGIVLDQEALNKKRQEGLIAARVVTEGERAIATKKRGVVLDQEALNKKRQEGLIAARVVTEGERAIATKKRGNVEDEKAVLLKKKQEAETLRMRLAAEKHNAALSRGNDHLKNQSRLMQNLHTLAASYISIFAGARLVRELVRITGEFEMQKVALQAILGDLVGANKIFDQVKQLAVKSPFQFKDLISYTKQLSAFSIPMNELYDTTKMLADVSAGLGVGMDRLVLAYGQIRAASVLRGQEVRQLTEAGIPVIEELRKKFEALGETGITAADVFDKISARLVPFEMIKEMFTDMTSEGGKFFQMQEIQAETLKGKVSNLTDAYQIMMAEIGEKSEGVLKGAVDGIRAIMDNYEAVGKAIMELVVAYGVYRGALAANNALLAIQTKYGLYDIATKKLQIAATLQNITAQKMLNAVMAINPYVAAAAAITALSFGLYKIITQTSDYEKGLKKLAEAKESARAEYIKEEFELSKLYDRLKNAAEGTKDYQDAKDAIQRKYGSYLNGLKNERGEVVELADAYQLLVDKIKESAFQRGYQAYIDEATTEYSKVLAEQMVKMDRAIQSAIKNNVMNTREGALLSGELNAVLKGEKQLHELSESAKTLYSNLAKVSNGSVQYAVAQTSIARTNINKLSEEAKRLFSTQTYVDGGEYPMKPTWMSGDKWLKDLGKYATQYNSALQAAIMPKDDESTETYLSRMRDDYAETAKSIAINSQFAGKNVDALKERLNVLSGAFKVLGISPTEDKGGSKAKDTVRALEKLLNERDNYRIKKETDTQNALIDEEIRGSKEKARVIESTYKKEIFAAELFKKERIKLVNEANGLTTKDKGYVSELSDIDLEEYTNLINNANEKRSRSTIKLEQDTASEITKIWKEATEQTLSNYDREKEAIIEKYRLLIERARDAAAEESFIYDIKKKEYDALISLDISYGLALINQEEDVKKKLSETSKKYFDEQLELRRQQLQVEIDAASERVAMLQAEEAITGKDNSREIQKWTEFIVMASKQQKQLKDNYFVIGEMLGGVLSQSSDEFVQKVGGIITTLSSALGSLQKAYGKDGTSLDKASSIVGLIMAANSMIKQAREESANPELSKQIRITKEISNRLGFERSINDLLRERQEIAEQDIFRVEKGLDRIIKATQRISELSSGNEGIISSFVNNAIFSAEGTGKRRLFGSKTGTYEFTLADILKGIAPQAGDRNAIAGGGLAEIVGAAKGENTLLDILSAFVDPSDILQGRYADANARKDAFLNLQKTVQDALKAMGKSVSDFANMSADDLLTFFELMESAGTITDEGTKKLLDLAKSQVEDVKKAVDDMKQAFSDIVGDLGTSLSDLLVDAFTNGNVYGAIDAFHNKIGDVISDIVEQMVFAATLKPFLKKAEVAFMASYGMKPDGSPLDNLNALKPDGTPIVDNTIIDDLDTLGKDIAGGISAYEKALREADEKLKGMGYKGITGSGTSSSLGGSIQAAQMTENTANLISSYINAVRADGAKRTMSVEKLVPVIGGINDTMANGLTHLAAINANTFRSANGIDRLVEKVDALTTPNSTTRLNATIKTS